MLSNISEEETLFLSQQQSKTQKCHRRNKKINYSLGGSQRRGNLISHSWSVAVSLFPIYYDQTIMSRIKKKKRNIFLSLLGIFAICLFFFLIKSHCRQLPDSKAQFSLARSGSLPWAAVSADLSGNGLSNRKAGRGKTSSSETEIPLCGCLSTGVPCPGGRGWKAGVPGGVRRKSLLWPAAPRAGPHCVPSLFCPARPPQRLGLAGSLQRPPGNKPAILEEA